jgi:hypothetical protein
MNGFIKILSFFAISGVMMLSCKSEKTDTDDEIESKYDSVSIIYSEGEDVITEKIMYDVCIVNENYVVRTKDNPDWFYENLTVSDATKLTEYIFYGVLNGEIQAYYYDPLGDYETFEPIPLDKQKDLLTKDTQLHRIESEPVEGDGQIISIDNVSVEMAGINEIKKLRFLEEWYFVDGKIHKNVKAVAPVFSFDKCGDSRFVSAIYYWVLMEDVE